MNNYFRCIYVSLIAIFLSVGLVACGQNSKKTDERLTKDLIRCRYYNEVEFMQSIRVANKVEAYDGDIAGGIVPHHLLACDLIASFFKKVSKESYECVVVIAPNHKREGAKPVNTAMENWSTPFGILECDYEMTKSLTDLKLADNKPRLLEEEHSISSIVPYIKYYLPDVKIVPILLHGNYGLKNSIELGRNLNSVISQKKTLVIASVDFSHYLTPQKADLMDEITLKAIKGWDIEAISKMTNDNMDSPPSIMTFLTIMKGIGTSELVLLGHDNSARIAKTYSDSTTSYFTAVYQRKK
ncbi:MAG TPA: AmmeMemoRadiSam system protein B [Pseudobacteroides sp.]|uniref:AmmeMemoRadiSam system protein B n=1 Tax=Pseudobacteroides sp. TaxID=1968840 RepID=UPI002F936E9A